MELKDLCDRAEWALNCTCVFGYSLLALGMIALTAQHPDVSIETIALTGIGALFIAALICTGQYLGIAFIAYLRRPFTLVKTPSKPRSAKQVNVSR